MQSEPLFNAWLATVSSLQPFHLPGLSEQLNLTVKRSLNKEEKSYKVSLLLNDKLKSPFVVQLENDSLL